MSKRSLKIIIVILLIAFTVSSGLYLYQMNTYQKAMHDTLELVQKGYNQSISESNYNLACMYVYGSIQDGNKETTKSEIEKALKNNPDLINELIKQKRFDLFSEQEINSMLK